MRGSARAPGLAVAGGVRRRARDPASAGAATVALMPNTFPGAMSDNSGHWDRAGPTTRRDRLGRGCEFLNASDVGIPWLRAHPRRAGLGRLAFKAKCPLNNQQGTVRCSGTIHLREATGAHRLLGVGTFPSGVWRARTVSVALTPLGRRRRAAATTVRLGIRYRDEGENFRFTIRWTITV
jgi:hypothetical protein